ncbi:hypothetical protein PWY87_34545 [Kribbella solani]|uniref:hypothetical protein n=1 Tax=Kribbella solani TaxID=236067 RepID=UPI0029B7810B|nr:hypothetical protein [Kribbella solani]MDX3006837.1 hypothetical protein [Kribbella solani]
MARVLVVGVVMVLVAPAGRVLAVDDPGPVNWPTVERSGPGNAADPAPVKWLEVQKPDVGGSNSDPKPTAWPEVQRSG